MKKLFALLLALMLLLTMMACGSKNDSTEGEEGLQSGMTDPDGAENGDTGTNEGTQTPDQPAEDSTNQPATGGTVSDQPVSGGSTTKPNTGNNSSGNATKPSAGGTTGSSTTKPSTGGTNGGNTTKPSTGGSANSDKGDLSTLMSKLLGDSTGEMSVVTEKIPTDAYKSNLFIDYIDGAEAVSNNAMMSAVAHSVCLLKLPEGSDASKVKAEIEKNMDPRKWVCVEAEKSAVLMSGNYIVLVMSTTDVVDTVSANFKSVFP